MTARQILGMCIFLSFDVFALYADEPKPKPQIPASDTPVDEAEKLRAAIVKDMQIVEKKLQDADAGDGTRSIQKRILENLDKLLDQTKNPPTSDESKQKSESQPMGSKSDAKSQSKSEPGGAPTRRERREAQRRQQQQVKGSGKPQPGGAGKDQPQPDGKVGPAQRAPTNGAPRPDGKAEAIADIVKDIWGHLPETMRQEVDRYYRVQFMPRHRELVEQYYLRLAETEKWK